MITLSGTNCIPSFFVLFKLPCDLQLLSDAYFRLCCVKKCVTSKLTQESRTSFYLCWRHVFFIYFGFRIWRFSIFKAKTNLKLFLRQMCRAVSQNGKWLYWKIDYVVVVVYVICVGSQKIASIWNALIEITLVCYNQCVFLGITRICLLTSQVWVCNSWVCYDWVYYDCLSYDYVCYNYNCYECICYDQVC
jgi:hypothetical protein